MTSPTEWMLIGRVTRPHGVRGEVRVESFSDFPERFARLQRVMVGPDRHPMDIETHRAHHGAVLLKFGGVDDPEAAGALRDQELFVPREEAVDLPEGHYYLDDLIGMDVMCEDGTPVGRVDDVIRTGSNDVYVVRRGRAEQLIPAVADAVASLDLETRTIVVRSWVLEPEH